MEARFFPIAALLAVVFSLGAGYRSANFIVEAPTPQLAEEIGKAAEKYRHDLAIEWLGSAMPNWSKPCPIRAEVSPTLGAGGATSFVFDRGEVFGWDMKIQGSEERVLDSVLPHEVTHTIFASYFRQPLPRWADEGACTTVEHSSEKNKQQVMLVNFLRTNRGIAFNDMFAMKEYPADVLPLYSQGYSLARFLIEQKGRREFLEFVGEGMKTDNWSADIKKHYGYANLATLQTEWLGWVKQGSPMQNSRPATQLASATRQPSNGGAPIYRAQNNDGDEGASAAAQNSGPTRRDAGLSASNSQETNDDSGWTSVGSPAQGAGERGGVIPANSGWYASQRDQQLGRTASAPASDTNASNAPKAASSDAPRNNVYDRQSAAVAVPPPLPQASNAPAASRQPEYVAQRDVPASASSDHKVLLDWTR